MTTTLGKTKKKKVEGRKIMNEKKKKMMVLNTYDRIIFFYAALYH